MTERSTISQVVQVGVEGTPGTGVAAGKRLTSLSIEPTIQANVNRFRPQGSKYETVAALGKEWTTANVTGVGTYDELIYPLSSIFSTGTHTTLPGGGEEWVFEPKTYDEDTPKTFTVEYGSSVRAHKFTYGIFTEFGFDLNREAMNLSGAMMGRRIQDGITLTASPTTLPLVPMLPTDFDVYIDPALVDIGTTKLGRCLSVQFRIGSRYNPLWVIDSTKNSWVTHVETVPAMELSVVMEADSAGMAYLTQLRDGSTSYIRVKCEGAAIPGATDLYSSILDMPMKIVGTSGFSDADGVYAVTWQSTGTHDDDLGASGGALSWTVVNSIAAL